MEAVTIYTTSGFGDVVKVEAKLVDYGTRQYAQYNNALFVKYIPKRKRKTTGFIKGYEPYVVILKGHGHPAPQETFLDVPGGVLPMQKSRYMSFDKRYQTDFDAKMDNYIERNPEMVVMDYRCTKGTTLIK